MLYKNKQGKIVGELKDGIFSKKVSKAKHLFKNLDAWGMDLDIIKELPEDTFIRIHDTDVGGIIYYASKDLFRKKGIKKTYPPHGTQVFLARKEFGTQALFQRQIEWFDRLPETVVAQKSR